jgi:hypothetical protein
VDGGLTRESATRLHGVPAEPQVGLCKTELIKPCRPWRGLADVELGTAEWVDWFDNQ